MKNEDGVRKWLSAQFGDRVLWIEHAAGGTPGMPDALVMVNEFVGVAREPEVGVVSEPVEAINFRLVPLELKQSTVRPDQWGSDPAHQTKYWWRIMLRPQQSLVMRRILAHGGKYFVLVGTENGIGLCTFEVDSAALANGDSVLWEPVHDGKELMNNIGRHLNN